MKIAKHYQLLKYIYIYVTYVYIYIYVYCFPGSSSGKKSSYNAGDPALSLGREDPLVKGSFIYIYIYKNIYNVNNYCYWHQNRRDYIAIDPGMYHYLELE